MHLYSAHLAGWANPADVFVQFYSEESNAFWLDREIHPTQPFSVIGGGTQVSSDPNPLEQLSSVSKLHGFAGVGQESNDLDLPFAWRPGVVGAVDYENSASSKFIQVDRAIVFDHLGRGMYFLGLFESQTAFSQWHNAALLRLTLVGGQQSIYRGKFSTVADSEAVDLRHSADAYLEMIRRAQDHIAAGDVYQICLTNQIKIHTKADPLNTFLNLREQNPAPYAAYMRFGSLALVCASPEQFLQVTADGQLSTKPIKGTRPRASSPEQDSAVAEELRENVKERAENLMIVDLMRNDLSRVAEAESVRVPGLFEIESYSTVHQLVSTVEAKLRADASVSEAMKAVFPGGSMTGAPKIRAMQIIDDLELGSRGLYSGAIGYVGVDGSADFGMTIRTLVFQDGVASLGVGGGITIDSEPLEELAETKLKAKALLAALNASDPWQ